MVRPGPCSSIAPSISLVLLKPETPRHSCLHADTAMGRVLAHWFGMLLPWTAAACRHSSFLQTFERASGFLLVLPERIEDIL